MGFCITIFFRQAFEAFLKPPFACTLFMFRLYSLHSDTFGGF
ncbi:hypothetical protein HMPREF9370_1057 [Neisseria wadsworthii 9715]|uniref:Uncharacterized protein n=1 Tax=Neisseria wadsworthii 9715 TaxID=1030841 RepID=G4CPP7_9NEIS|nr:hypothetical protein HMPREF9370_1057 [Neisseria wadsworthii 9715]